MGLFDKIFSKNKRIDIKEKNTKKQISPEYERLLVLHECINNLLRSEKYIARSEYGASVEKYVDVINYFTPICNSNLVKGFCRDYDASEEIIINTVNDYNNIHAIMETHNQQFIDNQLILQKSYLDNILKDVDSQIVLDEDQRKVVLTDEDYCLVVAGAGAGKTTTVAAKVKYLVEKRNVEPSQILVISFTNKAVNELRERINKELEIDCPIATFHSTGNAILHKQSQELLNIVDGSKLYYCVMDYLKNSVLQNEKMIDTLIMFFASYFDTPYEGNDINEFFHKISKTNYTSLRADLEEIKEEILDARTKKKVTIQNEMLRSYEEVEIANFLYLNNIDYQYEPVYPYNISYARKPYTPDFIIKQGDVEIYIEHFGITESGENSIYSDDQLQVYKKAVNDKIELHRKHNTKLIYTFSKYNDNRPLLEHLKEKLTLLGIELIPRSNREVFEKIISSEESKYIKRLVLLICRFINNFKTNGYTVEEFSKMYHTTKNVRTQLFLKICNECFLHYEKWLKENNAIDFQDMINESARILKEAKERNLELQYKYVIVDEYQDISRQRFDLTKALSEVTKAKIIAVGDDWQSIYAFSGSDITLFTQFEENMGYAKQLKIVKTYRNSQEIIDIAGSFIQKNTSQIEKSLQSPKHIQDPVIIYTYDSTLKKQGEDNRSGANYALSSAVETALEQIICYNNEEGKSKDSSILLLGRFGFDEDKLEKSGLFQRDRKKGKLKSVKYPWLNITFMTAHSSKGLGYDNVIIVNGANETYGFPSKIEDDPVLSLVVKQDNAIDYAEERRLFYVAMTRTKNRVFVVSPEKRPSEFLLEIKKDYKNVVLKGKWNEDVPILQGSKMCPICGFPLQLRFKKSYGLKLYMCTNEPEICDFITNDISGGKMSILKCTKCQGGYLIVKKSKEGDSFLGCTNYNKNGTGCGETVSKIEYYKEMNYQVEAEIDNQKMDTIQPRIIKQSISVQEKTVKSNDIHKNRHYSEIEHKILQSNNEQMVNVCETIYTVLSCLNHVSEKHYYGVKLLVDVLRGMQSQKLLKSELDKVSEYGALCNMSRDEVHYIVEWLIEKKFIVQTTGKYPVLHPTHEGMHYYKFLKEEMLRELMRDLKKIGE